MSVTTLFPEFPSAPNRSTDAPATFSSKADAFVSAMYNFPATANTTVEEMNTLLDSVNTYQINAGASATSAASSATSSANSATLSGQYKDAAETAVAQIEGGVEVIANYAALRAVAPSGDGQCVYVSGYSVASDGGAGRFIYNSSLTTTDNDGTIIKGWIRQFYGAINVKWFGAVGDGVTDDTDAIEKAIIVSEINQTQIYYPTGTYLITNFHKKVGSYHYGDYARWKIDTTTIPIPLHGDTTWENYTIYVDLAGDNNSNCGFSPATAYSDLQYAFDSLPRNINHQITIRVGDGVFNTNYLTGSTDKYQYPRNALFFARGKKIASRTQIVSGSMVGGIIIKGNGISSTVFTTDSNFDYGFYVGEGQIAFEDLQITGNSSTTTNALLVSHRNDTYVHCNNVQLDGNDKTKTIYGMYVESGGQIEFTGTADISNVSIGAATLTASDNITISDDIHIRDVDRCLLAKNNSSILVSNTNGSARGIKLYNASVNEIEVYNAGVIEIRGFDSNFRTDVTKSVEIGGTILINNGTLTAVYSRINGAVTAYASSIKLDNSDYQDFIKLIGSDLILRGSNSYVSPETSNTSTTPIIQCEGSSCNVDSGSNINPTNGWTRNIINHSLNDASVIPIYSTCVNYRLRGNGSHKVDCYLNTFFTDTSKGVPEGYTIHVYGDSWGVGFDSSSVNMDLNSDFSVGSSATQYTGATFMFTSGKWRLVGLGQLR